MPLDIHVCILQWQQHLGGMKSPSHKTQQHIYTLVTQHHHTVLLDRNNLSAKDVNVTINVGRG